MDAGPVFVWAAGALALAQWWPVVAALLVLTLACIPAIWLTCWRENHWRARAAELYREVDRTPSTPPRSGTCSRCGGRLISDGGAPVRWYQCQGCGDTWREDGA
jgi:hypothetical protein